MRIEATAIPGCFQIFPQVLQDRRGSFVKTFHEDVFRKHGLVTNFAEEYYSVSHRHVVRGMHFQAPPHDHAKVVYCVSGAVFDAVVDLREGSPTVGQFLTIELDAEQGNMLYIPSGLAHGFCALADHTIMMYKVTSVYAPAHDAGIRWDSIGIPWPEGSHVLSDRDQAFPPLSAFNSPFRFEGA